MKKTQILNSLKAIGILLFSILLVTCDVGLGPSIDTEAPELTIASPSASAILKGKFSLSGTVSDDGTISSVVVKLKEIGSSNVGEDKTYNATVDVTNKKWSLSLDSLGDDDVKDGNYELTVTAKDNSEKESYRTTTFYVDNTAPVLMISSPDVKLAASALMNYDIVIDGKVYDASEINSIQVTICDSTGSAKVTKNASLTGKGEWKVTFDGKKDLGLPDNAKLSAGSYYYYVKATDEVNNTSNYFFHKKDIFEKFTQSKLPMDEWAMYDKGESDFVSEQDLGT